MRLRSLKLILTTAKNSNVRKCSVIPLTMGENLKRIFPMECYYLEKESSSHCIKLKTHFDLILNCSDVEQGLQYPSPLPFYCTQKHKFISKESSVLFKISSGSCNWVEIDKQLFLPQGHISGLCSLDTSAFGLNTYSVLILTDMILHKI